MTIAILAFGTGCFVFGVILGIYWNNDTGL